MSGVPSGPRTIVLRPLWTRPESVALALFFAGTVLASVICLAVLDGIPHVQDEVSYLFQGKIFALLHFWVPEPPAPEFFQSGFIQRLDGRWFSKYPPGYPLMLIPTLWAGMPWLTNALSYGASLALIYLSGLRMFGLRTATWAGLLGLVSPWALFMSGSYMSHPTTMLWAALFLYALVGMKLAPEPGRVPFLRPAYAWGLLAGFRNRHGLHHEGMDRPGHWSGRGSVGRVGYPVVRKQAAQARVLLACGSGIFCRPSSYCSTRTTP